VGGKKKKHGVKKKHAETQPDTAPNPTPPRPWWNQMPDTNKVIAGGTIGLIIVAVAALYYQNLQYHQEHRPHVIISRTITMLKPLICDPVTGQGTAQLKIWIKNIGSEDAQSVMVMPFIQFVPETAKDIGPRIKKLAEEARSFCTMNLTQPAPGIPLYAGKEMFSDSPMTLGSSELIGGKRVQAFMVAIVFYSEADGKQHKTIELQRLLLPDGTRGFVACAKPITGEFDIYPTGSCEN
jgi:hypothetical protein